MEHKDIKILIVKSNKKLLNEKLLSSMGYSVLKVEHNGMDALKSISANKPQVILSEAFLPKLDFLGILNSLGKKTEESVSICISEASNDALASRLMKHGADYFFIHPCDYKFLSEMIDTFVEEKLVCDNNATASKAFDKFRAEETVIHMLNYIGMPSNLLGYRYVRHAIIMALEDETLLKSITKGLYTEIARIYHTKPGAVERAIRNAICVTWDRGNFEAQASLFGYVIDEAKGKPTNAEFIAEITRAVYTRLLQTSTTFSNAR